ncbi:MAG: hypothetical protein PSX36_05330 [bacterium]|nr:hypothetical protein [bacterium]
MIDRKELLVEDSGNILIQKLDEFIRRYYKNRLIRGIIYSIGILLAAFLSVVLLEYFGEFNSLIRGILFFGFVGASVLIVVRYILIPLLNLNRIGALISYDQAAGIIGNHFSTVQDKLLNVLQLQNDRLLSGSDDLLLAGINQKINELRPIPFTTAIDFGENKKHLRLVIPLFLFCSTIIFIWPQIISKSTERLVNYQTYYEKEMPFKFNIQNSTLEALQAQDYKLEVEITGQEIPNEVYIVMNNVEYKLEKDGPIKFHYTFSNIQTSTTFQFMAAGYLSKEYTVNVLPKPSLLQFNLQLVYPAYLNKPNESTTNTGDLQIPQGTKVNWVFHTRNTEHLSLRFLDTTAVPEISKEDEFKFTRRFLYNNFYTIKASNKFVSNSPDSVNFSINVIADQFPSIEVSQQKDSLSAKSIYFSGEVKDDYGFTKLMFHFKKFGSDSTGRTIETEGSFPIVFTKGQVNQPYFYFLDASQYQLNPGDRIEYFFEVHDNDGINGPKGSRTHMMTFKAPSREEINETTEKNSSEIKKDLEESIKKAKQLQKDVNELSKKINDKKQLGYEEKKKLEDLLKKQQELQNKVEEVKKENELNNKQQNEFSQTDESILEKQQQLQQLFENIMTPEMKKLFDELNKMLEKLDKNQVQDKLEELKLTNKDIEKELDRNLEAFKQLEVEQKMQAAIDRLDELQKKEEALNKQTEGKKKEEKKEDSKNPENKNPGENKQEEKNQDSKNVEEKKPDNKRTDEKKPDSKELEKKQDEIKNEFDKLKEELKDLEKKNADLEEPNKLPNTEKKQEEISKEMQKSSQQLNQNNKKDASQSQKSAAEKMEEMKEEMKSAMEEQEEKKDEENAQALRQILENLVNLSFGQEELLKKLPDTRVDNPQYLAIPKEQNKLKEDSKIIEDSLFSLSKRAPQISAIVNREISSINLNMDKTVKSLAERNAGESAMRMQSTMTSVNNLALLLNESLEQMQAQMKSKNQAKGQKGGKCKKPGSGTGDNPSKKGNSVASMRKLQEQLNKQLQDMKDAMEKGQKPGEKPGDKKGQKPGGGLGQNGQNGMNVPGSSEQFAKMAAQQEALRRQMQAMMDKLKNKGKNPGGDIANMMEETEKELVNKQISNATLKRQQDILSRLLESEKAEREREQDEQRKSNEAKSQNFSNPTEFLEYKRAKEKEMELLNTVPPSLTPYFKDKVDKYFNILSKE